jgi:hypothetical protein
VKWSAAGGDPNSGEGCQFITHWDDDDDDGWQPNDEPPYGTYTGDKDDPNIDGGDSDFRSFTISIIPADIPDGNVSLTFPGKVKVWETDTKLDASGESSEVSSGTRFPVADLPKTLYLEGVSGSSAFRDVELKAQYNPAGCVDVVKVTVFEVDLTGLFVFGDQQLVNEVKHSWFRSSSDKNGIISWDDANADGTKGDNDPNCEYFHNCMECQGTVKPSGVTNQVEFDFDRKRWARMWFSSNGIDWDLVRDETPWKPDERDDDEDKSPSPSNHIYEIDGPGLPWRTRPPNYVSLKCNLKEWVMVKIDSTPYQCSDYLRWHSKVRTWPKDSTYTTRMPMAYQRLGSGWISVNEPW